MSEVEKKFQNPGAVYSLPTDKDVQVEFDGQKCQASPDSNNPGFQCGDNFLKVVGHQRRFLLVQSGLQSRSVKYFVTDSNGTKTEVIEPTPEELMSPITGDFVDVRGRLDCR